MYIFLIILCVFLKVVLGCGYFVIMCGLKNGNVYGSYYFFWLVNGWYIVRLIRIRVINGFYNYCLEIYETKSERLEFRGLYELG